MAVYVVGGRVPETGKLTWVEIVAANEEQARRFAREDHHLDVTSVELSAADFSAAERRSKAHNLAALARVGLVLWIVADLIAVLVIVMSVHDGVAVLAVCVGGILGLALPVALLAILGLLDHIVDHLARKQ